MATNKLRAVKDKLPTKREIVDWPEEKILQLVKFAKFFMVDDSYNVSTARIQEVALLDEPYFDEFRTRIGNVDYRQYRYRLMTMVRNTLAWLQDNPFAITDTMRAEMSTSPRFSWCLNNFKMKKTAIGGEVVALDNRDTTDPAAANRKPDITNTQAPQIRFNQALMDMTAVLEQLTRSIKPKDLRDMQTKDKIRMSVAIAATLTKTFAQYKPNTAVFQQININSANREDLEKAFLDYAEAQDVSNEV